MRTLFLDLASNSQQPNQGACIACVTEDETASIRFVDNRISDDGLMPLIDEVLTEAAWTEKDLTNIACVVGPGGFTSLRMAVTLANTYADQLKIPAVGVHLSDVYAARVNVQNFIWMHSTKKTHLFIRGFGEYALQWKDPVLASVDELVEIFPDGAPVAGELIPEHRTALSVKNIADMPLADISDILPAFVRRQEYHSSILLPWYGRGW